MDYDDLYSRGIIAPWYLRESQLELYKMLRSLRKVVTNCHRRYGKGTTVFTYTYEEVLKKTLTVRYGAETQIKANSIFSSLTEKIFELGPNFKPKWYSRDKCYVMPQTDSKIFVFGVKDSGEIDKARGEEANIIILDEFAFWRFRASYVLKSVLGPQLDETNGQLIIASTPPDDLTHEYINQVAQAEVEGNYFFWDIWKSYEIGDRNDHDMQRIFKRTGGVETEDFKREYECQLIPTKERLVIPEAQETERYLGKCERPEYFDSYVCMDLGLRDFTAALFGYLDFKNSRIIIIAEYVTNYTQTSEIVASCKEIESDSKLGRVYRRIGDCELQQLFDMSHDHDYNVTPITKRSRQTGKGFRDSVLNGLRLGIQEEKVLIDPESCPKLAQQLKFGIWNDKRTDFQRTETMGHLDALMAMAYLYDNIDWSKNPFPDIYAHLRSSDAHFTKEEFLKRQSGSSLGKMVGR